MIVLFTDYGLAGPYIGEVEAVLYQHAPQEKLINLFADAPRNNPKASAYLLAAYTKNFPENTVFFSVVDPGVGTFEDKPVVMKIDGRWYVGPDNGLFDIVARQTDSVECWEIVWRPEKLSVSFHGRDIYAPVCAMLANGEEPPGKIVDWQDRHSWPDELAEIIYIDHFGNCMTGISANNLNSDTQIKIAGKIIGHALTFSVVPTGQLFWYQNADGLIEIAVNQGSALKELNLTLGDKVQYVECE